MKIPRQVLVGSAVGVGSIVVIAAVVLIAQHGLIGGQAQRLFSQASHAFDRGDVPKAQAQLEELVATFPDSPWADDGLLKLGEVYESQQQWAEARAMYQTLLDRFPDSPLMSKAQSRLGSVNIALLFSPTITDLDAMHEVRPGDTLGAISKRLLGQSNRWQEIPEPANSSEQKK